MSVRQPVLVLAFLVICATAGAGQTPAAQGLVLGVAAEGLRSRADGMASANGAGVAGMLGFGFTRHAAVLFGVGVGGSGHGLIAHAEIGARASLPVADRVVLFGELAFASHGREKPDESINSGTGVSVGLGGEYFVQPHRAITLAVSRWSGRLESDARSTLMRYGIGLNLRAPSGR